MSVIVPVYNEAPSIGECIRRLRAMTEIDELIVVNDGSDDGTGDELGRVRDLIDVLVDLPANSGKGAAVKAGAARARGDILVFHDSDLEIDPADIPALTDPVIRGTADTVSGNRMHAGNRNLIPPRQWVVNRMLTEFGNLVYGMIVEDIATGSRAIRKDLFEVLDISSDRFEFDSEIQAKAKRAKARIVEVPVIFRPRSRKNGKKVRWTDGVRAAQTLLRFRVWRPEGEWRPITGDMSIVAAATAFTWEGPKIVFDTPPPPLDPPSRRLPGEAAAPPVNVPYYLRGGRIARPESRPVRWDPAVDAGRETKSRGPDKDGI